jgi:hypothetical protein
MTKSGGGSLTVIVCLPSESAVRRHVCFGQKRTPPSVSDMHLVSLTGLSRNLKSHNFLNRAIQRDRRRSAQVLRVPKGNA